MTTLSFSSSAGSEVHVSNTSCLDEASILSFGRGDMAPSRRAGAETHIALCDECRVLVKAVRRASFVDVAEVTPPVAAAEPNVPAIRSHVAPVAASPHAEPASVELAPRRRGVFVAAACAGGVLIVVGLVLTLVAH